MKILLINEVYGILSTGRTVKELHTFIKEQGHQCIAACAYGKKEDKHREESDEADYYHIGNIVDRKLHALLSRISGLQGYFSIPATRKLIRYISTEKPDIVQFDNVHGNFLNLNRLLKYLSQEKIPVVIVLHDCWFYTGRCTHYTVNGCYQWREGCHQCPNNRNTPPTWFFDRSKKMWTDKRNNFNSLHRLAVIGVSDWITAQAECSFLKDSYLLKRIYNGIDLGVFKPIEAGDIRKSLELSDKFVILSVASIWSNSKGLKGFLKLAAFLDNEHKKRQKEQVNEIYFSEKNAKTDSRKDIKESVIMLVGSFENNIKVPDNVRIISATDSMVSLARLYNAADVFISLSKEESFGKTVAEALACGTPVITFASTALPELVGKNCGHLVSNNSLKEVYKKIEKIKVKGKEAYSEHCVSYAQKYFSKESNLKEYMSVYEMLDRH